MKKQNDDEDKLSIKFIVSLLLYVLFFIYEVLEKIFNYILLHIRFIKDIIQKVKLKLYDSAFYKWLKLKIDDIDEKTFLLVIVFLIVSSGLLIYVFPFMIASNGLKIVSIIIGKILSTLNIILNSMGIQKIFKIPFVRLFKMRVNKIKKSIKQKYFVLKNLISSYISILKKSDIYIKVKEYFSKYFKK